MLNCRVVCDVEFLAVVEEFGAGLVGGAVGAFHHTVVLSVGEVHRVAHVPILAFFLVFYTTVDEQRVFVLEAHAQWFGEPVGVGAAHDFLLDEVVGVEAGTGVFAFGDGIEYAGGFLEFECFGRIHQVIGGEVGYLQSCGERVVDLQLSGFGTAGLDDDDTVGGTGAVDGRGRGIFEYG